MQDRRLGRHHLAFYRGWLQGVELRTLADLYLESGIDLRAAKSTLAWVRDALAQAALRHGRHGEARLLRMRIITAAAREDFPSLDEYRELIDPDGFIGERELIALYLEAYPQASGRKARQRQRLLERQLRVLETVERLTATEPVRDDPVRAWFDPRVAQRLESAGLDTLGALMDRIETRGYRWWSGVRGLGEKGAARILRWLRGYEDSLGRLPEHAMRARRKNSPGEAPHLPAAITMARTVVSRAAPAGGGREPAPVPGGTARISAADDIEAMRAWIEAKAGSPHTARAYQREAQRLILWAAMERAKTLAGLTVEDCAAYRDFLSLLGRTEIDRWPFRLPQSYWIGPRNTPRASPLWRPFDGALTLASVKFALSVVGSFLEWLVQVGYLEFNPWAAVNTKPAAAQDRGPEQTRALTEGQIAHVLETMAAADADEATLRLRAIVVLAHATGMRLSEIVSARTGDLYAMPLADALGVRWMLKVRGKGGKARAVPITPGAMRALTEYLACRGLTGDPRDMPPQTPLFARLDAGEALSASAVYKLVKDLFARAAETLEHRGLVEDARALRRASTHWLRHSCGVSLVARGVPVNLVQTLLGHASLTTTSIYTVSDEERLWRALTEIEA